MDWFISSPRSFIRTMIKYVIHVSEEDWESFTVGSMANSSSIFYAFFPSEIDFFFSTQKPHIPFILLKEEASLITQFSLECLVTFTGTPRTANVQLSVFSPARYFYDLIPDSLLFNKGNGKELFLFVSAKAVLYSRK